MLEFFAKLKLNSIINKNPTKQTKRFLCWNDISSMAIIIESNKNLNKNNLDKNTKKTDEILNNEINGVVNNTTIELNNQTTEE